MAEIVTSNQFEAETGEFGGVVSGAEALLITGMNFGDTINQEEVEQLGLTGLQQMLGDEKFRRIETLGLKRIAQIVGLMGLAAKVHKRGYRIQAQSQHNIYGP